MCIASKIQDGYADICSLSGWKQASFDRRSVWCVVFNVIVFIWLGPASG